METKKCVRCGVEFVATKEFFTVDKRNESGITSCCRICERKRNNEYHKNNLDVSKRYREENKDILKVKKHLNYLKNKERYNKQNRLNYQNNKERHKELAKQWKHDNREKVNELSRQYYARHKEQHGLITKKWKLEHREERNIQWQQRYAKKKELEYTLTKEQWNYIKEYFNNECAYCGRKKKLTQDHFVPLTKAGEYSHNNIVPSCLSCNSSKSNKSFFEWYPKYKEYSSKREKNILNFLSYSGEVQQLEFVETKLVR